MSPLNIRLRLQKESYIGKRHVQWQSQLKESALRLPSGLRDLMIPGV